MARRPHAPAWEMFEAASPSLRPTGTPASGTRSSALWGTGGRRAALVLAILAALAALVLAGPAAASAVETTPGLLEDARANPDALFDVIVQGDRKATSSLVKSVVSNRVARQPHRATGVRKSFSSVNGVSAQLTGAQILALAETRGISVITLDSRVRLSSWSNTQQWVQTVQATSYWSRIGQGGLNAPAIAVVDSGVKGTPEDFGSKSNDRVVASVNLTSLLPNSPGDGRGHGTLVASLAAGAASGFAGVAPNAKIVAIDVMDDQGMAMTSDVIAAADWILANKARYNIRVANFSLHSTAPASVLWDPLDRAVQKLWFSGVVVVAAAGNYGTPDGPSDVLYAPANDPFIITVGASDTNGTADPGDDFAAPWSAYGSTLDGFAKPELAAPGRYMGGGVPDKSTMYAANLDRVLKKNYLWMSGTSFSAPVVAGAAAALLAQNPHWTPDQVKGALMVAAAQPAATAQSLALGVGVIRLADAASVVDPPNPNAALNQFVVADPAGGDVPVFDSASWASTAEADASWASASWASASWAKASWSSASWAKASWNAASWASASWASASWAKDSSEAASWAKSSWESASWSAASWAAAAQVE